MDARYGTMASVLECENGARLAYHHVAGASPTVVFLSGFASNMQGTKALYLEQHCRRRGHAYLRFDYQGHGESSGRFVDGTIGEWAEDAHTVISACTEGPLVLVGSSMGGWIMLLTARRMRERVRALVGIASAPDFTVDLFEHGLGHSQREAMSSGVPIELPNSYGTEPHLLNPGFISEAQAHLQLNAPILLHCPVRLVHGMADPDVPWQVSERLSTVLASTDVELILLKSGAHRLSEPGELARIATVIDEFLTGSAARSQA